MARLLLLQRYPIIIIWWVVLGLLLLTNNNDNVWSFSTTTTRRRKSNQINGVNHPIPNCNHHHHNHDYFQQQPRWRRMSFTALHDSTNPELFSKETEKEKENNVDTTTQNNNTESLNNNNNNMNNELNNGRRMMVEERKDDNNNDDDTLLLGWMISSAKCQRFLRDSGIARWIFNALTRMIAAPLFYYENPFAFPEFIRISEYPHWLSVWTRRLFLLLMTEKDNDNDDNDNNDNNDESSRRRIQFHKEWYGNHPQQRLDIMMPINNDDHHQQQQQQEQEGESNATSTLPLFVFVHGGAWGSGFPTMYRLISLPFLKRNYRAVCLGYRTYPDGTMEDQIQDLVSALHHLVHNNNNTNNNNNNNNKNKPCHVVLMGHSSGAHIAMMAALRNQLPITIDAFIGLSGVYDLSMARQREIDQNVTHISPMSPACFQQYNTYSPTYHLLQSSSSNNNNTILPPPPARRILLIHGKNDTIAPPIYSQNFYNLLLQQNIYPNNNNNTDCTLLLMDGLQHQDTVLETCLGKGDTQSLIFQWLHRNNNN